MSLSNRPAETAQYRLGFKQSAQKELSKLAKPIQQQFYLKLKERLSNPHVPKDALSGMPNCYKIKLRSIGFKVVEEDYTNKISADLVKKYCLAKGEIIPVCFK